MSFLTDLTARLKFWKRPENREYFFSANIGPEKVTVGLWSADNKRFQVTSVASDGYSSLEEVVDTADKLLEEVLDDLPYEPEKILFGVPDSWLIDDSLKDNYLTILRKLVKELSIKPMAYVSTSHALVNVLEKLEGTPPTAILAGIYDSHLTVIVVRAGKIDGSKTMQRSSNLGGDIERGLTAFSGIEVLPSRILLFGKDKLDSFKSQLTSFPWMSHLPFLHLPKIDTLDDNIEIKAVCFAGAVELYGDISYNNTLVLQPSKGSLVSKRGLEDEEEPILEKGFTQDETTGPDIGFMVGDVTASGASTVAQEHTEETDLIETELSDNLAGVEPEGTGSDLEEEKMLQSNSLKQYQNPAALKRRFPWPAFLGKFPGKFGNKFILLLIPLILGLAAASYVFLTKATVYVYVEPKTLERDAQVTADPKISQVDEENRKIPGQIVEVQVSGSDKENATGQKTIGDPAKGTVLIYNKTDQPQTFPQGTVLNGSNNLKFTLDTSVGVASQSSVEGGIAFGKSDAQVTATQIGADGNLPSGTEFTVNNRSSSQFTAKAEGNFAGGNSKEVTIVTDDDQKRLLAKLAASLREGAIGKLQDKLKETGGGDEKKILPEAMSEEMVNKSFSKNVNDQASTFGLNLTIKFKGTAYSDKDLKTIIAKVIETNIPDDFQLSVADTETQTDVSKLEGDGGLVFQARFKAKLMPRIDTEDIKNRIAGKTPFEVAEILKTYDNVLGSEIKLYPELPSVLQRLPFRKENIKIQVGSK